MYKPYYMYSGAGQGRGATYDNYGYQAELASRLHRDWPNGQKQIYVSQSSLYDSMSNMPGENGSRTSDKCKRCLLFFGIILLVSAIVISVVLAIYFSQRDIKVPETTVTTIQPTIPVPKSVLKEFDISLTTFGNFTPALNDSSSKEYKEKEASIKRAMDAMYLNSSLANEYNGTEVLGFSKGSIIVDIRVYFIIIITPASPTPAARNMTNPSSSSNTTVIATTKQPGFSIQIIQQVIEENAGSLKLDQTKNNSIQIKEITTTVKPTTTPIRTTKKTILTTETKPLTKPSLTTTEITKIETEIMRPSTEQPNIPFTEPSKTSQTNKKLTSPEPQPPILSTVAPATKEAPESTTQSDKFTPPVFSAIEPASQSTTAPFLHTATPPDATSTVSHFQTDEKTTLTETTTNVNQTQTDFTTIKVPPQNVTISTTSIRTKLPSQNITVPFTFTTLAQKSMNITALEAWETRYTETTINPIPTTQSDNCNSGLTNCRNGQCIQRNWFCDEFIDCWDASDEDDYRCQRNTTRPPILMATGNDLNCNFENHKKKLCNYKKSPGVYNWRVAQGGTNSDNTGPDFDHTFMNSKGHFLFTESSYGNYNDNASLTSTIVATDNISHSLTFYYHMYGAHMGSLEVYFNIVTQESLQRDLKWKESGNHGNMWLKACIEMPKEAKLSVEFVAHRGLNYTSDIAIDDIKYSKDSCKSISCSYEHSDCGHLNISNSNLYAWRRVRGEEMMSKPWAPKTDFTYGKPYGAFLVADSTNGNEDDKAIFRTPLIRTLKETTLNIRLYTSGANIGHLQLNLRSDSNLQPYNISLKSSNSQSWKRICKIIPKGFFGFAEFVAVRGNGASGFIAVDDVALGPETVCDGFSTCEFASGIFCNFDVIGKNYRWKHFSSLKGDYLIASGEGAEGSCTKLVSPTFTPSPNSSISFRYAIEGTSILSFKVTKYTDGNKVTQKIWTTEGLMTGVQTVTQNNANTMDWLTACFNLPMTSQISIEIVSCKIDQNGGKVALDWVNISKKQCEVGLSYSACDFDEPNLCNYEIECPISTQYRWKRNSGPTPTVGTGPPRDHTFNNTIGHYLFTESTFGRQDDKAVVTFINVQSTINTSIRFNYYMRGSNIGSLYIIVGGKSDKINWIQKGNKPPFWYFGCVDLPSNKKVNVSFYGIHGNGPLGDIAIDDVHLSQEKCPEHHISCNFENEMMCGYTGLSTHQRNDDKSFEEQWLRVNGSSIIMPQFDHTFRSAKGHFLVTIHPSKIMSPRIAYGQTMCLQFYYYIQMGKGQNIMVTADYEDSNKNTVKLFGTNGFSLAQWRHGKMTLISGNVSVIFSVEHYNQNISNTVFAIDDVSINYGKCPTTVCSTGMFKCEKNDICIPNYKKCDWVQDCSDGADELNCTANSSKIRLVDGMTSGDQGRLEIYVNGNWGTVYSLRWFESNAKVACRQLGYTGYYKSVRFGKFFFGLGDVWQITCIGNETILQDCDKVNVVHSISHMYDVGLACYNTVCEPGREKCPEVANSSVVYCLYPSQFCDGDFDCPGGEDEKNCSDCKANKFSCKNHECISKTKRCDGKPHCQDASDEMNCIRRDQENHVQLYHNDSWMPLCESGSNEAFDSKLCLIMGHGAAKRSSAGNLIKQGLKGTPNSSKMTVIGKYELSLSSESCRSMKLECYGQECGSRSQKMFDPFVQFGNQAVPMEYPWQAMLLRNGNFHCGASIFNSRWLITAEHCVVERYVKYEVVVGLLRMQDLNKFPKIKVIEIIHSMNYGSYKGIPINDIALILLEKDLVFTDYIQPVCLPSKVYTAHDYCYLSGWGRDENLVSQSHLKETKVYAISSEECKKYYDNITDNSFICFRHNKPNMPSCYGDSGGPLVCRNDRGRFELAGVVSFGLPLCAATNGTPAAFTNVLNFRGWIVDQTRCKMKCPDGKCLYEAETCDGIDHCHGGSDELPPTCTPTVTCNFNKPYKCGYRNNSNNPWYWASPHWSTPYMKSKPMIGGDKETDEYMLASVNATKTSPAKLISPKATEIPCISFKYLANANNTAKTVLILKAYEPNFSSYKEIWNHGKNNSQEKMLFWQLTSVSLPKNTTSLMFEAYYENPDQYSFIAIDSIKVMDKGCTAGCSREYFQCSDGQCILKAKKCNDITDCTDGSDEKNCTIVSGICKWNQFRCNNGQCIEFHLKCDNIKHCKDGSDEKYCGEKTTIQPGGCTWDQFRCDNGQCIQVFLKCDRLWHCKDGSDERNCPLSTQIPAHCRWDQFHCNDGNCIESYLKCDGENHCKDGSDEQFCYQTSTEIPGTCRWDQFRCKDGQCIQYYHKCDQVWHCRDGSDEQNCPKLMIKKSDCKYNEFGCLDGKCIEMILVCNQNKDCSLGEDEHNCTNTTHSIPATVKTISKASKTKTNIPLVTAIHPHITKITIPPGASTIIPLVTAAPIQHATRINIPLVTAAPIRQGTRINIPLVTIVPIQRGTRINIPLVTAPPIQHSTRVNIPLVTTAFIQRGTRINIPLVTVVPIQRGTRMSIPLVTATPIQHGTKINIPLVTVPPIQHNTRINIPLVTVVPIQHGTRINIPLITAVSIQRGTKINISVTTDSMLPNKTKLPHQTITSFHPKSAMVSHVTTIVTELSTRINVPSIKIHHKTRTSILPFSTSHTHHHRRTFPHISVMPSHHDRIKPVKHTTVPPQRNMTITIPSDRTSLFHKSTNFTPHHTKINIPYFTATTSLFHKTDKTGISAHHHKTSFPPVTTISTGYQTKIISATAASLHHHKTPPLHSTTTVDHWKRTLIPLVQQTSRKVLPQLTTTDKPTLTPWMHSFVTTQSNQYVTSSVPTLFSTTKKACFPNEFKCDENQCIPKLFVCDIIPDCDNSRDEQDCEKPTTPIENLLPKTCQDHQFRCSNGECILKSKHCDRMVDCSDNSDEYNCGNTIASGQSTTIKPTTEACTANQFQCDNGVCISISRYCDTFLDCTDGSDERCSKSPPKSTLKGCSYDDFRCDNGQCIPLSFHCDGLFDCNDRSDEKNCSQITPTLASVQGCGVDEFHCKNGHCIQLAFLCDGLLDCPDSSDEQNCPLTTTMQAASTTEFKICTKKEYECPSGKCINADYVCDGIPDCPSADDEVSCKVSRSSPETSIPPTDKCFPLEVKECLQVGYSRSLLPNVFGDKSYTEAMERFYMKAMPIIHQKCSKNALMLFCGTIFPLCKDGVSKYTCKSICREVQQSCGKDAILMDTCDWLVDDSRWCFIGLTGTEEPQGNKTTDKIPLYPSGEVCQKGYYQCKNSNLCLHPIHLCDGEPTCPQADDEPENCTCLPNQFRCASGQCVMKSRRCNGYQDCKDYSDERNCSENECVGRLCKSGQCVPSTSFCDGIFDCDDLSDEKLCECHPPHRRCNNQVCITQDKWCNREDNCGDNSDEKNCDCSIGEVMCSDGKCIPMEWWCDGNQDCSDGKDESHCHNCKLDEFICTRGYKCIKRSKVCDMKWDCMDGEDEATCVSLRKDESVQNTTAILTLTVQGHTSMVCSSKWSMHWASFICKYLRHKNVKKVEFVDPPPGTTSFQQMLSHSLESPEQDFIETTETCTTNKIVRMACNERICGTNRHHSIKYQEFIIGGDLARRYTWPWSVSLLYLGEPMCGATLISDRWLVTAAHCIVTGMWNRTKVPHYFSAILGEVDLFKGLMNGTRIPIDKIVFPGDMKLVVFNPDPDIALLRLKYSVEPSHQIEPICMPKLPKHDQGSTCYLAGWGGTHKPGESRRRYSNFLHEVRMIIRNTSECSIFQPQPNWEHNLCAGYLESTITGCYGDSGGALMCWEPDNRWTIVGVLSKGRYNCAANSPNVFTKISSMRQWIEESMGWTSEDSV